jgi:hypothetical protein
MGELGYKSMHPYSLYWMGVVRLGRFATEARNPDTN